MNARLQRRQVPTEGAGSDRRQEGSARAGGLASPHSGAITQRTLQGLADRSHQVSHSRIWQAKADQGVARRRQTGQGQMGLSPAPVQRVNPNKTRKKKTTRKNPAAPPAQFGNPPQNAV